MNWPFARKESRTTRAITLGLSLYEKIPPPADYRGLAAQGYGTNAAVYSCINEIARACAGVPWVLYQKRRAVQEPAKRIKLMHPQAAARAWVKRNGPWGHHHVKAVETSEIEAHPFLSLIERPNPRQAQSAFFDALIGYWLISGNSYTEILATDTGPKKGIPLELWQLRPDRIKIVPGGGDQRIAGYVYEVNSVKTPFGPEEILHQLFFSPVDDFYGLSPLSVAARAFATDNEAAKWNHKLLQNDARPSGALSVQGTLGQDEFDRLKAEIQGTFAGADNAHRLALLEGGAEWRQLTLSPVELDYLEGRKFSRVEIASILGVPPELIGDSEHKTYNSFPEARSSFYHETVLPLLDRIKAEFNARIVSRFGDNLEADYDRDQIEAIQEDRGKAWARLEKADWLTINEKREATGYDESDEEDADIPVKLLKAPAAPGSGTPNPNPTPNPQPGKPGTPDPQEPVEGSHGDEGEDGDQGLSAEEKQALTRAQAAKRAKFEKVLRKHFGQEGKALGAHLKRVIRELGEV